MLPPSLGNGFSPRHGRPGNRGPLQPEKENQPTDEEADAYQPVDELRVLHYPLGKAQAHVLKHHSRDQDGNDSAQGVESEVKDHRDGLECCEREKDDRDEDGDGAVCLPRATYEQPVEESSAISLDVHEALWRIDSWYWQAEAPSGQVDDSDDGEYGPTEIVDYDQYRGVSRVEGIERGPAVMVGTHVSQPESVTKYHDSERKQAAGNGRPHDRDAGGEGETNCSYAYSRCLLLIRREIREEPRIDHEAARQEPADYADGECEDFMKCFDQKIEAVPFLRNRGIP